MDGQVNVEFNPGYLKTMPGILKLAEIVLTILTFSLSLGGAWSWIGGGWVEFCAISCCITITIRLALHLLSITPQIFLNLITELLVYCVMTVMLLISGIVAAVRAGQLAPYFDRSHRDTIGVCSFFAFVSAIVCGVDATIQFLNYKKASVQATTASDVTTVPAVKLEY